MDIGDNVTLYGIIYTEKAWKDPWGNFKSGYMLVDRRMLTITDKRTDVPGMWDSKSKHSGFKAKDTFGIEWELTWEVFPDDSMFGGDWWSRNLPDNQRRYDNKYISWIADWKAKYCTPLVDKFNTPIV